MSKEKPPAENNLTTWILEYEKEKKKNMMSPVKLEKLLHDLEHSKYTYDHQQRMIDENMANCKEHHDLETYHNLFFHKLELILRNQQQHDHLEILQIIIDYCDEIPLIHNEYLKKLINLIDASSEHFPERIGSFASLYANLKLGISTLFNRNYSEAIRVLNTSRDLAKLHNEFDLMQISTLMIANALMLMGKYSEAIQLVDVIKVECKVTAFSLYCCGDNLEVGNLKPLLFSKEFYRETTDMFDERKPQETEDSPKVAHRDTLQSKLKNNPTVKKIEHHTNKLKTKWHQMFEK